MAHPKEERSLIILKPDCVMRGLLGQIIERFEKKGLKIIGLKMDNIGDVVIEEHYAHLKDRPFFAGIKRFMKSSPVVLMVVAGFRAVDAVRIIVGPTKSYIAPAGSIRGDFSMSTQTNIIHASDSIESATLEIKRFFKGDELFDYNRLDYQFVYGEDERA
ncbi:MAG: nucleoside-diphosphate kinase [Candidatus Vogelbacteria bacterium]|nr:nucleoside-diphosphate kinase [Candidatus Vogelbacteria bacterium]